MCIINFLNTVSQFYTELRFDLKLSFSSPVATAEYFKYADILSAAL